MKMNGMMRMKKIEFVSYDGDFPNLCRGTLVIRADGKEYSIEHALISGGSVWFDDDWNDYVSSGEWSIDSYYLPDELKPYIDEITEIVNENIPWGCCGGCV